MKFGFRIGLGILCLILAACGEAPSPAAAPNPATSAPATAAPATTAAAATPCPDASPIATPTSLGEYCGVGQAELVKRWWRWALAEPRASNPVADPTGASCSVGQQNGVWFLAGTTGGSANRNCNVPGQNAIFFPILNELCVGDQPCSQNDFDRAVSLTSIDGVIVTPRPVGTEPFSVNSVPGNPLLDLSGPASGRAFGLWVLVRPLTAGAHTISFSGRVGSFSLSVKYALTVT